MRRRKHRSKLMAELYEKLRRNQFGGNPANPATQQFLDSRRKERARYRPS